MDNVCETNNCPREQLRYDLGYLAPCNAFAGNMQEFTDLMRYLDKTYGIGKPRSTFVNVSNALEEACLLSDDMIMDFGEFGTFCGAGYEEVIAIWKKIYEKLIAVRLNLMYMLCLGKIANDSIVNFSVLNTMFDSELEKAFARKLEGP